MATVSITLPDAELARIVHGLCVSAGLPESAANAKKALVAHIKATVRNVETAEAQAAAVATVKVTEVTPS